MPFNIETCSKTGCFRNDGEVTWSLVRVFAVVVNVFDVLIEAEVEFPFMWQLTLHGTNTSPNVQFTNSGVFIREIDERIKTELVVGTRLFVFVKVVEVIAVVETEIKKGDVLVVTLTCVMMNGFTIVDVAISYPHLEGVRHRLFLLSCIEAVDTEHLTRHDAMKTSYWVEKGADNLTDDTFWTSFGVVEENVGHTMGHLTHCCTTDTCGEKVVDGRTVGFAENLPSEGTHYGIEEGDAVGVPVFTCRIVEHASVKRMGELVAREAVVVPHPAFRHVLFQRGVGDACPFSVSDEVVPTEHKGIDANVFDECLKSRKFGRTIGFLPKEMQGTGVGREGVWSLQMSADVGDGIIPNRVWLHNLSCVQRAEAAHDEEKNEMDATEFHLHEWGIVTKYVQSYKKVRSLG